MSRDIIIKINKKDAEDYIKELSETCICYDLYKKLAEALKKPYTNFDKIKDEMTSDDYDTLLILSQKSYDFREEHNIVDGNITTKEWLDSEVE